MKLRIFSLTNSNHIYVDLENLPMIAKRVLIHFSKSLKITIMKKFKFFLALIFGLAIFMAVTNVSVIEKKEVTKQASQTLMASTYVSPGEMVTSSFETITTTGDVAITPVLNKAKKVDLATANFFKKTDFQTLSGEIMAISGKKTSATYTAAEKMKMGSLSCVIQKVNEDAITTTEKPFMEITDDTGQVMAQISLLNSNTTKNGMFAYTITNEGSDACYTLKFPMLVVSSNVG